MSVERPSPSIVEGFRYLLRVYSPSAVVADSLRRSGVMSAAIRPATPGRAAGPAFTVRLWPGEEIDALEAIGRAEPGDVIVVDAFGEVETAVWGGLMSGLAKMKGIAGAVVDGSVRDIDESRDLGFPIWSRGVTPRSTQSPFTQRFEPLQIGGTISCGGVVVRPGDIVVADEIGVTVVPREEAAEVLARARAQAELEERARQRIREGRSVEELLREFGRL